MADLITRPEHSIIKQSYDSRERKESSTLPARLNADGFGVAWFAEEGDDPSPCVFTSTLPAWNNKNLVGLCDKIISQVVFAHIRAASIGSTVTEANCHPFCFGRYVFMHNGHLAGFGRMKRRMIQDLREDIFLSIQGTTDSEHAFAVFLDELSRIRDCQTFLEPQSPQVLLQALKNTLFRIKCLSQSLGIQGHSYLNFALSDGNSVLASRVLLNPVQNPELAPASLYYSCGTEFKNLAPSVYRMAQRDRLEEVVIISSERLTLAQEDWMEVPRNSILMVNASFNVTLHAFPA
jgi:glutamine amidotransferase